MTNKVRVRIEGLHTVVMDVESDNVELITFGKYAKKGGKHYIKYDELDENSEPFKDIRQRGRTCIKRQQILPYVFCKGQEKLQFLQNSVWGNECCGGYLLNGFQRRRGLP